MTEVPLQISEKAYLVNDNRTVDLRRIKINLDVYLISYVEVN